MPREGDPVWEEEGAVGRGSGAVWPFEVAGPDAPPPRRSAMDAVSSTKSGGGGGGERVRFPKCLLEGPEDGALGVLGDPNDGMGFRSDSRGGGCSIGNERRRKGRCFFEIVTEILG